MSGHIFVDETKRRGYVLVASVVMPNNLSQIRQMLRGLVWPGQRRLHMKAENDSRRRAIADSIAASPARATIYDAGRRYSNERQRRAACRAAIIEDATRRSDSMLVLGQDDTLVSWDNQHIIEYTRACGSRTLRYEHRRASAEPALAIPDAVAWCWAKGGDWRRRIQPIVTDVRQV